MNLESNSRQNIFKSIRGRPLDIQGLGRSGDEKLFISRQSDVKFFFHVHATPKYSLKHFL